jgi:hypothetical protein
VAHLLKSVAALHASATTSALQQSEQSGAFPTSQDIDGDRERIIPSPFVSQRHRFRLQYFINRIN